MPVNLDFPTPQRRQAICGGAAVLAAVVSLAGCGGSAACLQQDEAKLYAEAVQASLDGNRSRALELLTRLIAVHPRPAYHLAAGVERLKAGDAEGAAGHARAGLDVEPVDEDLRWLEGMAKKLAAGVRVPAEPRPPSSRK
jgi:predicted Zn-dependent protease